MKHNFKK